MHSTFADSDLQVTVAQLAACLQEEPTQSLPEAGTEQAGPTRTTPTGGPPACRPTRQFETEIIPILPLRGPVLPLREAGSPARSLRRAGFRILTVLQLTALMLLSAGVPEMKDQALSLSGVTSFVVTVSGNEGSAPAAPVWAEMTEPERTAFVADRSRQISLLLGENPHTFNADAVQAIRNYVEQYAQRAGITPASRSEGLTSLFARASRYAPLIVQSFRSRNVPVIVGLYLPMIESEYRDCLESPYGAKGLFQFIPSSARAYGVEAHDLCNIEKMAPAAAQYIADRVTEFGTDARSMSLVLLSFNRSPDAVRRDLTHLRRNDPQLERSFWTLFAHAAELDSFFRNEGRNYVPKFFAAAIVGENPEVFGLPVKPLSSYDQ